MPASERYGATQTAPAPPARGPAPAPPAVARRAPQHGDGAQRGLDGCSRDPGGASPRARPMPVAEEIAGRRTSAALSCIAALPVCCPTAMRPALKTLTFDHRALQQTLIFKLLLLVFGSASGTFHLCLRANGEERACVCGREEREHAPARARARARARAGKIERVCVCV